MTLNSCAPRLTKSEIVLVLAKCAHPDNEPDNASEVSGLYFAVECDDSDTGYNWPGLGIEYDRWCDMGCPSVITVTIQPGDLLNGGN